MFGAIAGAGQRELRAGELVTCREVVDRARVEQERNPPIDSDRVAGDKPRIPGEEAEWAGRHHRGVGVGHHELVVMIDGDRRRAMSDRH